MDTKVTIAAKKATHATFGWTYGQGLVASMRGELLQSVARRVRDINGLLIHLRGDDATIVYTSSKEAQRERDLKLQRVTSLLAGIEQDMQNANPDTHLRLLTDEDVNYLKGFTRAVGEELAALEYLEF